ncbi:uncharacterized protein LOC112564655 [Pomacea canaliculata]|uniref:uncharacterized protein LOC112564655 n=1 Tax=Pomacea canaliculata TaxID=400727 RepID=UPI000D7354FD|nr:uncharacterized protein LOC112564655 [Pomacea canaliculata]
MSPELSLVHLRKPPGFDNVRSKVLEECASQLGGVFTRLFQLSLDSHIVPRLWCKSAIMPLPKKPNSTNMKDFHHVAVMSVVAKCLEKVVGTLIISTVADRVDPLQFAYKPPSGVSDANFILLDAILQHLDASGTYVWVLFMDFSSTLNTVQPHLLVKRLLDMDVWSPPCQRPNTLSPSQLSAVVLRQGIPSVMCAENRLPGVLLASSNHHPR